ncbi:polysaccharide deacetylase family protein [Aureispira anguillae]|uniref:Polysaccharide deacetylase family protein n=1 Tax=Aureispira anguillae TaxID=2864201 RepID=A0A916DW83_9BACT|nr:polysaccharide deacetylase family protein [Aureispira anguillae]BDS13811.1 polysaccharide deacetylase family protein [Aureispira anguillae]
MYYPVYTSKWIQWLFPSYLWRMEATTSKKLFITFDDGPIPMITPWVLEELRRYNAKATFFCVGANVQKNPMIYQQLLTEGHSVGNHTFNHLNGWTCSKKKYLENVARCQDEIQTNLFRPPYGRLSWRQARALKKQYKIVMWDVIAGDFDPNISGEDCWQNILKHASNGSVIVLHDSKKAWERLRYVLPKLLAYYNERGFVFEAIPQ